MQPDQLVRLNLVLLICVFLFGCNQTGQNEVLKLSEKAEVGKRIFMKYECGKCHNTVGEKQNVQPEMLAPDLTQPFLANDSSFVKAHFKFIRESEMPDLDMTDEEIKYLSFYIAELHNSQLPVIPKDEIDAYDPVCYAPVSKKRAEAANLIAKYMDETYYFATKETLMTFKKAPEAYIELFKQYKQENLAMQF